MIEETQIRAIIERNARVEADKAWERSLARRMTIAAVTYVVAAFFFWINDLPIPLLQAFIPTGGYVLSTLTLPWMKRRWLRRQQCGRSEG